ncbi:neutral zinc metallopeptidase [Planobispora siamensis]|uniref:Peptidase n=1 Tax=Planobispora siamensis TaxID=936338 RepID=A0A8J3SNJ0_9ACTN|nr:neutral zinc metallopeptidase [Planobispora siamensis]GIH97676.1 peptidase [Planobispora siamensis]
MRTPRITVLGLTLAGVLLASTTAAAAHSTRTTQETAAAAVGPVPTGSAALKRNPLYRSGEMTLACGRQPQDSGSSAAVKAHLSAMLGCLNTSWAAQLKKAGLPFAKPKVRFITKPTRVCGSKWGEHTAGVYCIRQRQMTILIDEEIAEDPANPVLLEILAHEYAHHVQTLSGIMGTYARLPVRSKAHALIYSRRLELQAECLAGVFLSSVWDSQEYTAEDWQLVVDSIQGSGDDGLDLERGHGKGDTRAAWLQRGFDRVSPAACNTWSAPPARVA